MQSSQSRIRAGVSYRDSSGARPFDFRADVDDDDDDARAGRSSCSSDSEVWPLSPAPLCYSYTLQLDTDMERMLQPCHPIPPHSTAHCFFFQLELLFFFRLFVVCSWLQMFFLLVVTIQICSLERRRDQWDPVLNKWHQYFSRRKNKNVQNHSRWEPLVKLPTRDHVWPRMSHNQSTYYSKAVFLCHICISAELRVSTASYYFPLFLPIRNILHF